MQIQCSSLVTETAVLLIADKVMLGNCLSHTKSLTNKDQREFEQLTTEEAKVNRDDYRRGRLFKRMVCVSKD